MFNLKKNKKDTRLINSLIIKIFKKLAFVKQQDIGTLTACFLSIEKLLLTLSMIIELQFFPKRAHNL